MARLCSEGVCIEALTSLCFRSDAEPGAGEGFDPVNEWTLQLLRIRHLGSAEQRLHALIEKHRRYTGSAKAKRILENWAEYAPRFVKVMPRDYAAALKRLEAERHEATSVAAE